VSRTALGNVYRRFGVCGRGNAAFGQEKRIDDGIVVALKLYTDRAFGIEICRGMIELVRRKRQLRPRKRDENQPFEIDP